MRVALVAGATGLVGNLLLEQLLQDTYYGKIVALSRKPLSRSDDRLVNLVVDFDNLEGCASELKADDVFCCLGTTIRQAGSQAAFRKVDFDYPVLLARITREQGAKQFLLVTALGSDTSSSIFYNRVKGEVEEAIAGINFPGYHVFRPSMLLGERKDDRAGESAGKAVMRVLDFLIPKKYKAIDASRVARGMLQMARRDVPGRHVHSSEELQLFTS
jgi:uncharacterized protein YbjT (DUF2867 family)